MKPMVREENWLTLWTYFKDKFIIDSEVNQWSLGPINCIRPGTLNPGTWLRADLCPWDLPKPANVSGSKILKSFNKVVLKMSLVSWTETASMQDKMANWKYVENMYGYLKDLVPWVESMMKLNIVLSMWVRQMLESVTTALVLRLLYCLWPMRGATWRFSLKMILNMRM